VAAGLFGQLLGEEVDGSLSMETLRAHDARAVEGSGFARSAPAGEHWVSPSRAVLTGAGRCAVVRPDPLSPVGELAPGHGDFLVKKPDLSQAWAAVTAMTWLELTTLGLLAVWNLCTHAFVWMTVTPGLGFW